MTATHQQQQNQIDDDENQLFAFGFHRIQPFCGLLKRAQDHGSTRKKGNATGWRKYKKTLIGIKEIDPFLSLFFIIELWYTADQGEAVHAERAVCTGGRTVRRA